MDWYTKKRACVLDAFELGVPLHADAYCIRSNSKRYKLEILPYFIDEGIWHYMQADIYHKGEYIDTVHRSSNTFPYEFVEEHKDTGHDYLVCAEDAEVITVVDLTTGTQHNWIQGEPGTGFFPARFAVNESRTLLAVDGCEPNGPREVRIYDFSNPTVFPYTLLATFNERYDEFYGWENEENVLVSRDTEIRRADGVDLERLMISDRERVIEDYVNQLSIRTDLLSWDWARDTVKVVDTEVYDCQKGD